MKQISIKEAGITAIEWEKYHNPDVDKCDRHYCFRGQGKRYTFETVPVHISFNGTGYEIIAIDGEKRAKLPIEFMFESDYQWVANMLDKVEGLIEKLATTPHIIDGKVWTNGV